MLRNKEMLLMIPFFVSFLLGLTLQLFLIGTCSVTNEEELHNIGDRKQVHAEQSMLQANTTSSSLTNKETVENATPKEDVTPSLINMPVTSFLLSRVSIGPPPYNQGRVIFGEILSKDGTDAPTNIGGDIYAIRVVFEDIQHSITVLPVDNNNGTYSFSFPLLWNGTVKIEVELVLTSAGAEYLKMMQDQNYIINDWTSKAVYKEKGLEETVSCNVNSSLNQDYCDLTKFNGQTTWFCQKPITLSCNSFTYNQAAIRLPEDFNQFRHLIAKDGGHVELKLQPVTLLVNSSISFEIPNLPSRPAHGLSNVRPQGYFKKDQWVSLLYQNKKYNLSQIVECCKNKTIIFFGDSNTRFLSEAFTAKFEVGASEKVTTPIHLCFFNVFSNY